MFTIFLGFLDTQLFCQTTIAMLQLKAEALPQQEPTSAERLANNTQSDDLVTERGS